MTNHTKGPWLMSRNECHTGGMATIHHCINNDWIEIWTDQWCDPEGELTEERMEANALLMLAAPELLHLVMSWRALQSQWHPDRYESEKADLIKETDDLVAKISKAQSITDDDGIPL